ncbi:MAG: hypothetical protein ABIJ96_18840 [Elusimicrobiota bacterium]
MDDFEKELRAACGELPRHKPEQSLWPAVERRLEPRRLPLVPVFAFAAAAAVLALILRPSPDDPAAPVPPRARVSVEIVKAAAPEPVFVAVRPVDERRPNGHPLFAKVGRPVDLKASRERQDDAAFPFIDRPVKIDDIFQSL